MGQILRVSIKGDMPGGEVWSVNPCWEINGAGGDPVSPATALTIATNLNNVTVPAALTSMMAPTTRVTGYRVESRALDGTLESQAEFTRPTPVPGVGSGVLPYGSALVLSLRTPGVGGSARGRMYWPATGALLFSTNYRLSTPAPATVLAGFKTFLLGIEAVIVAQLPNANLTVWSRTTENFHNVNALRLGDVIDSQRRRRDAILESYSAVSYP